MSRAVERLLLALARRIALRYGWTLVRQTPHALLPSRVQALEQRIRRSGHLGHRFHVRRSLERDLAAVLEQIDRLGAA